MSESFTIESHGVDETLRIGRAIGESLVGGEVICLVGELGAGKTHLVKGIARGLGVADERIVTSPTFVLVNEYAGRVPVFHLDAYRVAGPMELEAIGFEEMCGSGGVVVMEWADRVRALMPAGASWVELAAVGETERTIKMRTSSVAIRDSLSTMRLDR